MKATRQYLEEEAINEIAQRRRSDKDPDVYDLIFTVRKLRRELSEALGHQSPTAVLMQTICFGLQDAIAAHGPITQEFVSSAAKRVYGRLRGVRQKVMP